MKEILEYTIFSNGTFSFTIGTVVSVALLLVIVRILLFLIKKVIYKFFITRRVDASRRGAIYSLIKYFVWTITFVIAMEMVGIHVTILIAGSAALLVGLGLGLQQIFQDLVSGIFILIEGTIKVNDVIELDGMVGKILKVDLRTSKVLTRDGIMIIVPNHKFIIENITNWTHNSESTRFKVEVGVAYGSDVQLVKTILLNCANEQAEVIKEKDEDTHKPFVRFINFGDSALQFEIFFWTTNIFHVEYIKSDLRFAIDKEFRAKGITIPFPQRDIHVKQTILPGSE